MKIIVIILLLVASEIFAQTDWVRWGKANYSYAKIGPTQQRDYSLNEESVGRIFLKSFADAYWIFISDVDGDNCSFNPTCSNFFIQSVKQTNLVQGTLMFFDRFTRDMDVFGKYGYYPQVKDGHFYDPVSLYLLESQKIKYISPSTIINN